MKLGKLEEAIDAFRVAFHIQHRFTSHPGTNDLKFPPWFLRSIFLGTGSGNFEHGLKAGVRPIVPENLTFTSQQGNDLVTYTSIDEANIMIKCESESLRWIGVAISFSVRLPIKVESSSAT